MSSPKHRDMHLRAGTLLAALLALLVSCAHASDPAEGRKHYGQHCVMCHGSDGRPVMAGAPDFTTGQGLLRADATLLRRIQDGGSTCPGYWGVLSREEILDLIAYLRTLLS